MHGLLLMAMFVVDSCCVCVCCQQRCYQSALVFRGTRCCAYDIGDRRVLRHVLFANTLAAREAVQGMLIVFMQNDIQLLVRRGIDALALGSLSLLLLLLLHCSLYLHDL